MVLVIIQDLVLFKYVSTQNKNTKTGAHASSLEKTFARRDGACACHGKLVVPKHSDAEQRVQHTLCPRNVRFVNANGSSANGFSFSDHKN